MITIKPEFYDEFFCIAGECKHSCCKGWEIDIDEGTAAKYLEEMSPFGEKLRENIKFGKPSSFRLTQDERCPFLQDDGLCRIILEKGEDFLCEICSMHPRFFTYYRDFEFAGMGLCCEKSCELLLSSEEKLRFRSEKGEFEGDFHELLKYAGIDGRSLIFTFEPSFSEEYFSLVLDAMKETEPINKKWTEMLCLMEEGKEFILERMKRSRQHVFDTKLQRIFQMILYRQLEKSDEYDMELLCAFARFSTQFILYEYLRTDDLNESVRSWSEQIEYDTDNVNTLLERIMRCRQK